MSEWAWDADKARRNWEKHRVSFEAAVLVFDDPMLLSEPDPHPDNDRWRVIGRVAHQTLFVVHTVIDDYGLPRIISARRATASERKRYDAGYS
jgi:uncharacterized DUF497 family protein